MTGSDNLDAIIKPERTKGETKDEIRKIPGLPIARVSTNKTTGTNNFPAIMKSQRTKNKTTSKTKWVVSYTRKGD